jgi:hypothetical protein
MIDEQYKGTSPRGSMRLAREDITAEWLTKALDDSHPGTAISHVSPAGEQVGMGVKIKLKVKYASNPDGLPGTLILKAGFGRHRKEMDFPYWTEMRAYRYVLPNLPVLHPTAYFAGVDPLRGDPIVIMEDLTLSKVHFNNVLRPFTFEQMATALEAMASYHSRWWGSSDLFDDDTLGFIDYDSSDAFFEYVDYVLQAEIWSRYMSMPRGGTVPRILQDHSRIQAAMHQLREFHKIGPVCTVHGDCHFGNSYLTTDGKVGWLDWNIKKAPWYKDVAFFLVSGLDPVDRRGWERALLSHYLRVLEEKGVRAPLFDEAWLAYRREIVHGLLIWSTNGDDRGEFQLEPINTGNTARFVIAALDHSTLDLFD